MAEIYREFRQFARNQEIIFPMETMTVSRRSPVLYIKTAHVDAQRKLFLSRIGPLCLRVAAPYDLRSRHQHHGVEGTVQKDP